MVRVGGHSVQLFSSMGRTAIRRTYDIAIYGGFSPTCPTIHSFTFISWGPLHTVNPVDQVIKMAYEFLGPKGLNASIKSAEFLATSPLLGTFLYQLTPSTFVRLLIAKVRLVVTLTFTLALELYTHKYYTEQYQNLFKKKRRKKVTVHSIWTYMTHWVATVSLTTSWCPRLYQWRSK